MTYMCIFDKALVHSFCWHQRSALK